MRLSGLKEMALRLFRMPLLGAVIGKVLFPFLVLLLLRPAAGQSRLNLQAAPSENRISENASRCMIQDSKGYLWIGTIDGLNRYDGYGFRIYRPNPLDSNSVSGPYIKDLLEDQEGNIWVATHDGLSMYRWDCDCFTDFSRRQGEGQKPPGEVFTDLLEDDQRRIWVSSYGGLSRWLPEERRFVNFLPEEGNPNSLIDKDVTALALSRQGGIWLGYQDRGISYFENGRFTHFLLDTIPEHRKVTEINGIYERTDGWLWLGTNNGIFLFDPVSEQLEKILDGNCWGFLEVEPGRLWTNIGLDQVYEWDAIARTFRRVPVRYEGEEVKGDLVVYLKDATGIIWATHKGLAKQDIYEKRFRHVTHEKGNFNSLSSPLVAGILIDEKDNPVVVTNFGGVNYFDRKTNKWRNYHTHPFYDKELKNWRFPNSFALIDQKLWLISYGQLYSFHLKTGALKKAGLTETEQWGHVHQGPEKELWLIGDGRIYRYHPERKSTKLYRIPGNAGTSLLYTDDRGVLWAASYDGLYRYRQARDSFFLFHPFSGSDAAYSQNIICMSVDHRGDIWLGRQFGLLKIERESRQQQAFTRADGLPSDNINAIQTDDQGRLWISTNYGLSRLDPRSGVFHNFDKHDGLQDEIFLPRSTAKGADGTLYFGGVNGFNVFHPDSLSLINPNPPKILISDLKIFNRSVRPGAHSVLKKHISDTRALRLSYKHSSISFELTALGYSQPENNQYAYMIEGVDPGWNYVGGRQTATYTGLPKAEPLLFMAKAANHDGVWTEEPVVLKIYIDPPFWEKTWFKLALLALIIGGAITLYQLRIYNIKQRNRWLEGEVRKQTAEIEQQASNLRVANKELQQQAATIRKQLRELNQLNEAQSRFFTSLSHEFRTPLTLLLGNLEELLNSEDPQQVIEKISRRMKLSAYQLVVLVNQLMDTAKLESGQYRLRVTPGDFCREMQNIIAPFHPIADRKDLELSMSRKGDPPDNTFFDLDILNKILNNLLSNAIKFTEEGGQVTVRVNFQKEEFENCLPPEKLKMEDWVQISVQDTGSGISPEHLPFIFDRFYQVPPDRPEEGETVSSSLPSGGLGGVGIGLALVTQLVDLHKGVIEVCSERGEGTTFQVFLSLAPQTYTAREQSGAIAARALSSRETLPPEWYLSGKSFRKKKSGNRRRDAPLLLVVEDNEQIRSLIVRYLLHQYRVLEAEDGRTGWKMATRHLPDLIISDVIMPEMNGFKFCRQAKSDARTSHIPFILLTALNEQQKKIQGLKTGADAYLAKPFSREELLLRIDNLLTHRERLRQQFLKEINPDNLPGEISEPDREFLKKMSALIDENLDDPGLSIDNFTRELGISRTQLFRKLKGLAGMSATEFIRDYRLRRAYQLLQNPEHNVSEVIYATGFKSRSYFYQCFKKKFGMAPTQLQ